MTFFPSGSCLLFAIAESTPDLESKDKISNERMLARFRYTHKDYRFFLSHTFISSYTLPFFKETGKHIHECTG